MLYTPNYENILGSGACGIVFKSNEKPNTVAIKIIKKGQEKNIIKYCEKLKKITKECDNLVTIYDVSIIDSRHMISMEYLTGKDLIDVFDCEKLVSLKYKKYKFFCKIFKTNIISNRSNQKIKYIIKSVLYALDHLHKNNIIHGDIKPENIRLLDNGQVKLFDFSFICKIDEKNKELRGTVGYIAPEMIYNCDSFSTNYNEKVDIWSLGVTLFTMVENKFLFSNDIDKYIEELFEHNVESIEKILDKNLWDNELIKIFKSMINYDVKLRYSAEKLLNTYFL